MSLTHKLALHRGGLVLLKSIISTPNWYESKPQYLRAAGTLLELPEMTAETPEKPPQAWLEEEIILEVSEKGREALKACVEFYSKKAAFSPSKFINRIMAQLGMDD